MLSVERFKIAEKNVWIAVLWRKKIQGITFALDGDQFSSNIKRLAAFLKKRMVRVDLTLMESRYPGLVQNVIVGKLDNADILLELSFEGVTPFERRVYEWLTKNVKRGNVITYGDFARVLNTSPRAVGGAMMRNPYPIVVPCHRVVASNGIGNYTPKVSYKKFLLEIEGVKRWTNSKRTS